MDKKCDHMVCKQKNANSECLFESKIEKSSVTLTGNEKID